MRVGGECDGGGSILDTQLGVDLLEMLVDGARAQAENLGDVAIGLALAQPRKNLAFAAGQSELLAEIACRLGGRFRRKLKKKIKTQTKKHKRWQHRPTQVILYLYILRFVCVIGFFLTKTCVVFVFGFICQITQKMKN